MKDVGNGPFNPKLSPASKIRAIQPRCCATCHYFHFDNGWSCCTRPNDDGTDTALTFDNGDLNYFYTICNRYRKPFRRAK